MAHTSLATRLQAMNARHRLKVKHFERSLVRKSAVSLAAASFGAMQRMGVKDDIKGVPWKPLVWLGATLLEATMSNPTLQAFSAGVSDATMAIYIDRSIANKSFVAGDELAA
jgi:hypothetical protein